MQFEVISLSALHGMLSRVAHWVALHIQPRVESDGSRCPHCRVGRRHGSVIWGDRSWVRGCGIERRSRLRKWKGRRRNTEGHEYPRPRGVNSSEEGALWHLIEMRKSTPTPNILLNPGRKWVRDGIPEARNNQQIAKIARIWTLFSRRGNWTRSDWTLEPLIDSEVSNSILMFWNYLLLRYNSESTRIGIKKFFRRVEYAETMIGSKFFFVKMVINQ